MILPDVNVLVYAYKTGVPEHEWYRDWLADALHGPEPVALSDLVLAGVVRVVTHPRVFDIPSPATDALQYVRRLREAPTAVVLGPGQRHWSIFIDLVASSGARGNLVPDAFHAALAIEHGCEWITTDRGFARFPGLRWRHPLGSGA
jgi:toxin-antitoxin system PIN domain toxin